MKCKIKKNNVDRVKKHLFKMFPHAKKIDVIVRKTPNNEYESKILVLTPKNKIFFAVKKDNSTQRALNKSYAAIIRQIHKVKTKWNRMKSKEMSFLVSV